MHSDDTTRYSSRQVVFAYPFRLGTAPEVYPAGAYTVETAEAACEGLDLVAFVRTSTVMVIPTRAGTCDRLIDAGELDEALKPDAEPTAQTD